ncbi:hypothetical protein BKA70DRAFT_680235 [Coprinopsis sp. MPI-PUGE-AT-0042]|nr:hypothetical protein BKA70DRAFT_680235 [Coprinopsis sp. MPI-PUGE-AT-0042]
MAASKITATEKLLLSRLRAPQLRTKYIAPARSGNMEALSRLEAVIQQPNAVGHVTDILDIYFSNVDSGFIPSFMELDRGSADAISKAERAWISIRGIWRYLEGGGHLPPEALQQFYEAIRPRLLPHISNISRWLLFFLDRSPITYLGQQILHSINHHPTFSAINFFEFTIVLNDLKQPFLSNDEMYRLCVRLWSLKTRDVVAAPSVFIDHPNEYLVHASPEKVGMPFCPVIWTIWQLMQLPYSRPPFMRAWRDHCEALGMDPFCIMAESILSRLSVLQMAADKRPPLLAPLWENLWYLGGLLTGFAYSKERPTSELVFGQKVLAEP